MISRKELIEEQRRVDERKLHLIELFSALLELCPNGFYAREKFTFYMLFAQLFPEHNNKDLKKRRTVVTLEVCQYVKKTLKINPCSIKNGLFITDLQLGTIIDYVACTNHPLAPVTWINKTMATVEVTTADTATTSSAATATLSSSSVTAPSLNITPEESHVTDRKTILRFKFDEFLEKVPMSHQITDALFRVKDGFNLFQILVQLFDELKAYEIYSVHQTSLAEEVYQFAKKLCVHDFVDEGEWLITGDDLKKLINHIANLNAVDPNPAITPAFKASNQTSAIAAAYGEVMRIRELRQLATTGTAATVLSTPLKK